MRGTVVKQIVAILFTLAFGHGLAVAQTAQTDAPDDTYAIDEPSEDVDTSEATLYQESTDQDAVRDVVERFSQNPDHFSQTDGQALYETTCQACHMQDGKGAEGAGHYPPLTGNPKLVSKYYILTVLLTGYHGMPRFGDQMDDAQIAEVANYVRNNFGNAFPDEIAPEDVQALRSEDDK